MDGSIMRIEAAECLECECKILLHEPPLLGQVVFCPECYTRFEVCQVKPLELDWADDDNDYDEDLDYEEWD